MKRLSPHELLNVWESGMQNPAIERSLLLLGVLYDSDRESIGRLSIGERDARLLAFREWIFGPKLVNISQCPVCNTRIEWETDTRDIRLQPVESEPQDKVFQLEEDGYRVDFRLPNSLDMLEAMHNRQLAVDPAKFLSRCILSVYHPQKGTQEALPPHLYAGLEERMAAADPQADITMVLSCPECKYSWNAHFDILNYLWMELDTWAKKLLREVATLARAFGWSEKEILGMGHHRRNLYLEMIS